ncbi:MAG: ERF family protein [Methylobacterium sp.]|nr:ERF family protein [Methylobacterium sp.]
MISMIERAARDPSVDIDKMERLMLMQERALERRARAAYAEALALMQPELPSVARNGKIEIRDKSGNNVIQSTAYARWEDINDAIKPALAKHGFSLSFKVGMAPDGKITVTGILMHREGHQEETTITLPHDATGSKNAVQAVGSSTSYGKRYTAGMLLNLTSHGEDDDGKGAVQPAVITDEQSGQINDLITAKRANIDAFLKYFRVECVPDLPAKALPEALDMLNRMQVRP